LDPGHRDRGAAQHPGRLRFRQARLRRPRDRVPAAAGGAGDPGAGVDDAAVPDAQADGPDQHLRRRGGAGHGRHLRHFPGPPIRALDPRRTAGGAAHRRRRRAADLLPDRAAGVAADPGDPGDVQFPRRLERFHVAADRAQRRTPADLAGGAGLAVARARAGQRDDDGRFGGDRG
ncbi:hypothetical protein CATMIT_01938, partial [Catenibacterium mitsuokai DSM 15897]